MSSDKREASPEASPLKGPAPKAVPEDTSDVNFEDGIPLSPMAADQAVQFISGTPANGDAKVELGDGSATAPTFVGLGKEELMKYANDPFWVRLRWLLFILFWVLWIAMLVGAVVIIVLAPRCAEKKTEGQTYIQIKASDLIKESKIDENTGLLKDLDAKSVIIVDALQHDGNNPEAVTNFENYQVDNVGLLTNAIEKLRSHGISILLQIIPNHSGTSHEWFTNETDRYVHQPFDKVKSSVWSTHDSIQNAWTADNRTGFENTAYLQQFSGKIADLNFRNDEVVAEFKRILNAWRDKGVDGFLIGKASYLVENLEELMTRNSTVNQPENADIVNRIVGMSSKGPTLVELNDPSEEILEQYIKKGFVPLIKSIDTSNSEKIKEGLEALSKNEKAVINLSGASKKPQNDRMVNFLASAIGSHSLVAVSPDDTKESTDLVKKLVAFQAKNHRGKSTVVTFTTQGDVVAALRSDQENEFLIIANFGFNDASFSPNSLNVTEIAKAEIVLATNPQTQVGAVPEGPINIGAMSGVILKLEKKQEVSS